MTKTKIKKALIDSVRSEEREKGKSARYAPGMITATQLARFLNQKNVYRVKQKYLQNIECFESKRYLIDDVAEELASRYRL